MSALSPLGRAACAYAERFGWAVFPLRPKDKRPLGGRGFLDATANRTQIETRWRRTPDANIGMACGEASGGIFAVDIDPRNGGEDSWAQIRSQHQTLPETPQSLTGGGGQHVLFWGEARCTVIAPGVDIKAGGGYIVLPPSVHPSGGLYEWDAWVHPTDVPVAEAPAWLLNACGTHARKQHHVHTASVDPRSFVLGAAFAEAGWLGTEVRPGVFAVLCPNAAAHSCGEDFDSSSVIFAPSPGHYRGAFHCSHEHCRGVIR